MQLLEELVSINSIFPNEREIGEYAEKKLHGLGFKVQRQYLSEGRFNVLAERGSEGEPVLFYAHLDSVPVYGKWQRNPFELHEQGDRLYGVGSYDIKAGIAAILKACETQSNRRIKVAFGVDEENDSAGANLILGLDFLADISGIVATEILDVPNAASNCVMLGRRGRCVLQIEVPGKSAHGGHAGQGINAINEAARLIQKLEGMELPDHPLLPKPNQFIRKIAAENTSLSLPDSAVVELDRHLVLPEDAESARTHVQEFVDSLYAVKEFHEIEGRKIMVRIKPREVPYLMPYVTSEKNELAIEVGNAVRCAIKEPRFVYGATVADENVFATIGLPVITLGPTGGNQHAANEWVSKQSYLDLIEVLKEFIRQHS
jgi:acetylornithine deacetylase/succinyl-diaminopimelate desuccinylase-like protein